MEKESNNRLSSAITHKGCAVHINATYEELKLNWRRRFSNELFIYNNQVHLLLTFSLKCKCRLKLLLRSIRARKSFNSNIQR